MATVKTPNKNNDGSPIVSLDKHKPLYHAILGLNNLDWEKMREKASQKAGNPASKFFDDIKEKKETHEGRRKIFDLISRLNAPRIAARLLEQVPHIHSAEGGNLGDQLHQLLEPGKYPK